METPEQEAARVRAEVAAEMEAEESGTAQAVDAASSDGEHTEPEKAPDPWEGVNPALKQAFDEMSTRVGNLTATEERLKQAEKRIGSITNDLHAAKKAVEAPTKEQLAAAAESDEKWDSLKKDFPEWAEAFDGRFDKKLAEKMTHLREELKAELKTTDNLDLRLLNVVKPKWKETIKSKEWKEWLAMQPSETAAKVYSERAEDAIDIITAFEEANRPQKTATEIAAERKERLTKAPLPQGGKATPVKSEADMSSSELRANIGKEIFAEP